MESIGDVYKLDGDGNLYLILEPVPTLIDTGGRSNMKEVSEEISKIIPLENIKVILFTHLHYDHCENVVLFPSAKLYASDEEIEDFQSNPEYFFFNMPSDLAREILTKRLEQFPKNMGDFEVIEVPGHTRGSVAFLDKKRKLLFSGDTLFNNGIGRTDFPNSVPEKMDESVSKLINLVKKNKLKLCPGHDY